MLKDAEAHLALARKEREYYKSAIEVAKEVLWNTFSINGEIVPPAVSACLRPMTNNITKHFSFDMAQQVY